MKRILILMLALLGACLFIPAQAQEIPAAYKGKTRVTMGAFGTVSSLCLYDDYTQPGALGRYDRVWEESKRILEELDMLLSVSIPTSEIARFNALAYGESMPVSDRTAQVFMVAQHVYEKTGGYFDPTVFPLVDLWGYSPRFRLEDGEPMPYDRPWQDGTRAMPDKKYIEGLLKLTGLDGIVLEGDAGSYVLRKDIAPVVIDGRVYQAQIDLGGIAKGYAADCVAQMLAQEGYEFGYFSCGSSSMRMMKSASAGAKKTGDAAFSLQVRNPRKDENSGDAYAMVRVMDQSLSSSGDYDDNYVTPGGVVCHIINPKTGYPLNFTPEGVQGGVSTVTLLSGSAAEDDALTTALCLMGPQGAIDYVNKNLRGHSVALVLYRADSSVYEVVTNIPEGGLEIVEDEFVLASRLNEAGNIVYTGKLFSAAP